MAIKMLVSRSGPHIFIGYDCYDLARLAELEYQRAKDAHPENPAFHMRPMFYTCSAYAAELLALAGA